MSAPVKMPPAPFDARQLVDTLDTMGLLMASLSDRIDTQGRMLEQVLKTATEARAAAFAAEKATDWKRNGDLINEGKPAGSDPGDDGPGSAGSDGPGAERDAPSHCYHHPEGAEAL